MLQVLFSIFHNSFRHMLRLVLKAEESAGTPYSEGEYGCTSMSLNLHKS
jgi:hypothetical protein